MKSIMIVEDDNTLGDVLMTELSKEYDVKWARTKKEALDLIRLNRFDLLILDIGLPDGNGLEIANSFLGLIRPLFLFLTAQNDPEIRLQGFEAGAEDFIPKPYHLKEVLLRVRHVLRSHISAAQVDLKTCSINLHSFSIHWPDGRIEYPPVKDMMILKMLIDKSPTAVSRDDIINTVWGEDKNLSHRTIDNAIVRLRQVLNDQNEELLKSVRGIGYQWIQPERSV